MGPKEGKIDCRDNLEEIINSTMVAVGRNDVAALIFLHTMTNFLSCPCLDIDWLSIRCSRIDPLGNKS